MEETLIEMGFRRAGKGKTTVCSWLPQKEPKTEQRRRGFEAPGAGASLAFQWGVMAGGPGQDAAVGCKDLVRNRKPNVGERVVVQEGGGGPFGP